MVLAAVARHCCWVLEQPNTSVMKYHPRFALLKMLTTVHEVHVWMGMFGGKSPKGTHLFINLPKLGEELPRPLDKSRFPGDTEVAKYHNRSNGNRVVDGGRI